ncbi:MAG: extracellular solute-binding protein, partial [bacterium]
AYTGQLALGDPSKSGSIAKCYEMMLQQVMAETMARCGAAGEAAALAQGWDDGLLLIRCLCANARDFTNSAGQVTADVATGAAAAGICIDAYGRAQQEWNRDGLAGGKVVYVTPAGGTSVSADPIGLLRGAPHAETARRFLDFVLSPAGQRLWDYRVGTAGGPERYALRRLPIRRDLYTPADRAQMSDGAEDPFALAGAFTYHGAWTGPHFNLMRLLIRVLGVDCHPELRAAWNAIGDAGGPDRVPEAMAAFRALPFPYAEAGAAGQRVAGNAQAVAQARAWSAFFRAHYRQARDLARAGK